MLVMDEWDGVGGGDGGVAVVVKTDGGGGGGKCGNNCKNGEGGGVGEKRVCGGQVIG